MAQLAGGGLGILIKKSSSLSDVFGSGRNRVFLFEVAARSFSSCAILWTDPGNPLYLKRSIRRFRHTFFHIAS
jgi:hypothetical protein